jgi:16S rRNA (cytosine967-C5)-methyltransferase
MCLRVNRSRISREGYLEQLDSVEIGATACRLADQGVRLNTPLDVLSLPGFSEGLVSVQDEAAQLAAPLLQVEDGDRVLDACSAPGGKTCHILEANPAPAELIAMDTDPTRLARVKENLERLDLHAELLTGDGRTPPERLSKQSFDRILVDAPCSGTGVIRRHPDIRLLRRPEDISSLATLQLDILRGLWPLLKPNGVLLYVTCSILPEENSDVIGAFVEQTRDAALQPLDVEWGLPAGGGRLLLPSAGGPDGLFFARLTRRPSTGQKIVE